MVKVTGPGFSLSSSPPLRKKRSPYGVAALPSPPPPVPEHVEVTAGDPAPDPDCTGTYEYYADIGEQHAYRRTTEPFFYIWYEFMSLIWELSVTEGGLGETWWNGGSEIQGSYTPEGNATGVPIVSEVIP
jgi:hypothetical protein